MLRLYKITGVRNGTRKRRYRSNKKKNLKRSKGRSRGRGRSKGKGKGKSKRRKGRKGRKSKRRGGNGKLAGQQYSELTPVSGMNTLPPRGENSNPYFTSPGHRLSATNSALATPGNIFVKDHTMF